MNQDPVFAESTLYKMGWIEFDLRKNSHKTFPTAFIKHSISRSISFFVRVLLVLTMIYNLLLSCPLTDSLSARSLCIPYTFWISKRLFFHQQLRQVFSMLRPRNTFARMVEKNKCTRRQTCLPAFHAPLPKSLQMMQCTTLRVVSQKGKARYCIAAQ